MKIRLGFVAFFVYLTEACAVILNGINQLTPSRKVAKKERKQAIFLFSVSLSLCGFA
jgi:hypothetical protein